MFRKIFILLLCIYKSAADMEAKVVGPETNILNYPHSAFILISRPTGAFICGSSILNQRILLTAAHCLINIIPTKSTAFIGHTNRVYGEKYPIAAVKKHQLYNPDKMANDVGLILVQRDIKFSTSVQRVAITPWGKSSNYAAIAGWGTINEDVGVGTQHLHHVIVRVIPYHICRKTIKTLQEGYICAREDSGQYYPSTGDSGSALVVKNFIQIGLVSYKVPLIDTALIAFSDVTFYYKWIKSNAKLLYCQSGLGLGL